MPRYARSRSLDVTARSMVVDLANRSLLAPFLPVVLMRGIGLAGLAHIGPLRRLVMRGGLARWVRLARLRVSETVACRQTTPENAGPTARVPPELPCHPASRLDQPSEIPPGQMRVRHASSSVAHHGAAAIARLQFSLPCTRRSCGDDVADGLPRRGWIGLIIAQRQRQIERLA